MQNDFTYCPRCGGKNIHYLDGRKWGCDDCGFKLYNNVAAAVGLVITDENGDVLFEVRAKDPQKGYIAIPGGFCNPDESAEQSAVRECMEETGLAPEKLTYLCSFPNTYDYKTFRYKTCDLFFEAQMPAGTGPLISRLKPQETEVSSFVVKTVHTEKDIHDLPIAFESTRQTLTLWLKQRHQHA